MKTLRCYVDGSWSPKGNDPECSGWGVLFEDGTKLSGIVPHEGTRQIAGECEAVIEALGHASECSATQIVIFYDYQGLPEWATGTWKAKNEITKHYQKVVQISMQAITVKFVKVDASANKADALATAAIGINSVH